MAGGRKGWALRGSVVGLTGVCVLLAVAVLVVGGGGPFGFPSPREAYGETKSETLDTKAARLPRLVDVGADKCIPCVMMAPILEGLKKEYKGIVGVEFVDVWKNGSASQKYGIRVIPTQIFYDAAGKELYRHMGFMSREEILAKFHELGMLERKDADRKKP
jgi:thioredoxin 1